MARARAKALVDPHGPHQTTIFERLESLSRIAETHDPRGPAMALFCAVLALMGLGLVVQASHASTIMSSDDFQGQLASQIWFRCAGLVALLLCSRVGPSGVRKALPVMLIVMAVMLALVWAPVVGASANGSHRWLNLGLIRFQPSELARIVLVLWIAHKCVTLGPDVTNMRRGVVPMLVMGLGFFGLIAFETDIGGAMLLLACMLATMWVGGARPNHVFGTFAAGAIGALATGYVFVPYIRRRIEMFLGHLDNNQVTGSLHAIQNGGVFGLGVAQGEARNIGVPYLESDFVFAQVGEELGWFGILLVVALLVAFLWQGLRLVLSIRDKFEALATFGLLFSTALQALVHIGVAAGLAPPKGMTLPFISHGGTSLVVSCIGVGLAIGAARTNVEETEPRLAEVRT